MFEKLKQAWKRDPLAVLGVGSVAVAFLLWALPRDCGTSPFPSFHLYCRDFFGTDDFLALGALFAFSVIVLLLRRR